MSIPEHISTILPRVLAGLPGGGISVLQPCPVCKVVPQTDAIPDRGWIVGCRCTMKIEFYPTEAEAIAAWNRRQG